MYIIFILYLYLFAWAAFFFVVEKTQVPCILKSFKKIFEFFVSKFSFGEWYQRFHVFAYLEDTQFTTLNMNGWNIKMTQLKRNIIFLTSIFFFFFRVYFIYIIFIYIYMCVCVCVGLLKRSTTCTTLIALWDESNLSNLFSMFCVYNFSRGTQHVGLCPTKLPMTWDTRVVWLSSFGFRVDKLLLPILTGNILLHFDTWCVLFYWSVCCFSFFSKKTSHEFLKK